jgi:alkylation response protein AidB-like acyl-CoA dehydrogenase
MVLGNEASFIGGSGGGRRTSDRLIDLARLYGRQGDPVVRQELVRAYSRERIVGLMGRRMRDIARRGGPSPFDPALMKVFVTDSKVHTGQVATAIAGPAGMAAMADDDQVSRWVQAEVINRFTISIGGGTTEVQKNNLGERSLGLPREPRSDKDVPWKDVPRS